MQNQTNAMNKTVELVNYWGEFEGKNPDGSIADFCRDFLAQGGQERGGSLPETNLADLQENLLRVDGRIANITTIFSGEVLNGTGVKTLEEVGLLMYVGAIRHTKTSEAIYNRLLELSR